MNPYRISARPARTETVICEPARPVSIDVGGLVVFAVIGTSTFVALGLLGMLGVLVAFTLLF